MTDQIPYKSTIALLVIEFFLIFAPILIMGPTTGWPSTLGDPASSMLPAILQHSVSVTVGYLIYLIYSILILPMSIGIYQIFKAKTGDSLLLTTTMGLGIASTVFRSLGIVRWLSVMPILAERYVAEPSSELELMYVSMNAYAGDIGEILGVNLFMGIWVLLLSYHILTVDTSIPKWLGIFGIITTGFMFSPVLEMFGLDLGAFIIVISVFFHFFLMFLAVTLYRSYQNIQTNE